MAYQMEYPPLSNTHYSLSHGLRRAVLSTFFFLFFAGIVRFLWPQGAALLRSALLPSDSVLTAAALEAFAESMRSGISVAEALEALCRPLIQEAVFVPG